MKTFFLKSAMVLLTFFMYLSTVNAQSPDKMSYQAVIRDAGNNLVTNTTVGMQISILQGSVNGTVVYTETQTPMTNSNGLVSIEIGGGTGFDTISWANGSYFIKTETDLTGTTNYTITGTSQLLSVPYALHAKTAESFTGAITETDPIYINSQAANITATDIANLGNLSGTNTGDQDLSGLATKSALGDSIALVRREILVSIDGSETKVTAGTNITVSGNGTTESPYVVNATGSTSLKIGQRYQGGIIFWLDGTGQHGLIASTADQSTGISWYNGLYKSTSTTGDGLYAGAMNTAMIIVLQIVDNQTGNYAAKICADYSVTDGGVVYGDWYLPSKYELNLLYQQKSTVGGFASAYYWCSTECGYDIAWIQYFGDGYQDDYSKNYPGYVRAIRAF